MLEQIFYLRRTDWPWYGDDLTLSELKRRISSGGIAKLYPKEHWTITTKKPA